MAYINNNKIKGLGGIKRAYLNNTLIFQAFKKDEEVISSYDITSTFNVTSTTSPTKLYFGEIEKYINEMEIDGIKVDVTSAYTFNTLGEHTVEYMLRDKRDINSYAFKNCNNLTSIVFKEGLQTINFGAFYSCSSLSSITIPSSVIKIEGYVFYRCTSLKSITCLATTSPSIDGNAFKGLTDSGTLYIKEGSDYSTWTSKLTSWTIQYLT